jgi:hypothetical protein
MTSLLITPDIRYYAQLLDIEGRVNIPDDMEILYGVLQVSNNNQFGIAFVEDADGNHIQLFLTA